MPAATRDARAPACPQVLAGRVAVVTGGGQGIGRAHALALAAHGARVVVNSRSADAETVAAEIVAAGGEAIACRASVADHAEAGAIVDAAVDRFGAIDILVNNAGTNLPKLLADIEPGEFDALFGVNVRGHLSMIQHAVRAMTPGGGGRIINTASGSWRRPMGNLAYAASKAALVSLTWGVAWELRHRHITCNAIAPFARTRMVTEGAAMLDTMVAAGLVAPGASSKLAGYPGAEFASPLVVYLASPAAAHISGQIFRAGGERIGLYSYPDDDRGIKKLASDGCPFSYRELAARMPAELAEAGTPWWGDS